MRERIQVFLIFSSGAFSSVAEELVILRGSRLQFLGQLESTRCENFLAT
jgi:hypothetical protein